METDTSPKIESWVALASNTWSVDTKWLERYALIFCNEAGVTFVRLEEKRITKSEKVSCFFGNVKTVTSTKQFDYLIHFKGTRRSMGILHALCFGFHMGVHARPTS